MPLNSTSMSPSPSAPSDVPVTVPVNRSGSLGNAGTPNRIASRFTIASGPAQSVRNRTHSPLVVRMFMNMLGEPCFFANSGSWCTGMKSRDAMAPATMTVAVTGISSGVTSSPTLMSRQSSVVVRNFVGGHCSPSSMWRRGAPIAPRPSRASARCAWPTGSSGTGDRWCRCRCPRAPAGRSPRRASPLRPPRISRWRPGVPAAHPVRAARRPATWSIGWPRRR